MMINYLFYRFSKLTKQKSAYWAKIFVCIVIAITLLPATLTASKYFFGCYDQSANDGTIKLLILVIGVVVMMIPNFYYSPHRIKAINTKYATESKLWGNMKLLFITLLLASIFWFGSTLIRHFIDVPEC